MLSKSTVTELNFFIICFLFKNYFQPNFVTKINFFGIWLRSVAAVRTMIILLPVPLISQSLGAWSQETRKHWSVQSRWSVDVFWTKKRNYNLVLVKMSKELFQIKLNLIYILWSKSGATSIFVPFWHIPHIYSCEGENANSVYNFIVNHRTRWARIRWQITK